MTSDGIAVLDAQAVVLAFNRAGEAMAGRSAAEVVGRPIGMLLEGPSGSGPEDAAAMRRQAGTPREWLVRPHDGAPFPVEVTVTEAGAADGTRFICVLRDLRPRRDVQERMAVLQGELAHFGRIAALDQMGSALAHELNQPLTAISLYLQSAARLVSGDGAEAASPLIAKARREAERAARMIAGMRGFAAKRTPERSTVPFIPLVEDAVELGLIGRGAGIKVARRMAQEEILVLADAVQIQQVIVNLVRNALDAVDGQEGGRIDIAARTQGGRAWFSVTDGGAGIAAGALADLFRPFATSKRSGSGLGLAISRTIAESHGGEIRVDPGGNGQGATFSLVLPLAGTAAGRPADNKQGSAQK